MSLSDLVQWIYYTPLLKVALYIIFFWAGLQLFSMLVVKGLERIVEWLRGWADKNK